MPILTHYCDSCGKRFSLDNITLNDMRELRIILLCGEYWHIPCSKVRYTAWGPEVDPESPGKIIKINQ